MENFKRNSRFLVQFVEGGPEGRRGGKGNCEFFSNPIVFYLQIV